MMGSERRRFERVRLPAPFTFRFLSVPPAGKPNVG